MAILLYISDILHVLFSIFITFKLLFIFTLINVLLMIEFFFQFVFINFHPILCDLYENFVHGNISYYI